MTDSFVIAAVIEWQAGGENPGNRNLTGTTAGEVIDAMNSPPGKPIQVRRERRPVSRDAQPIEAQ